MDSQIINQQRQIEELIGINKNTLAQLELSRKRIERQIESSKMRLMDKYNSIIDKFTAFTFHYPNGQSENLDTDSMKHEMSKILSFC